MESVLSFIYNDVKYVTIAGAELAMERYSSVTNAISFEQAMSDTTLARDILRQTYGRPARLANIPEITVESIGRTGEFFDIKGTVVLGDVQYAVEITKDVVLLTGDSSEESVEEVPESLVQEAQAVSNNSPDAVTQTVQITPVQVTLGTRAPVGLTFKMAQPQVTHLPVQAPRSITVHDVISKGWNVDELERIVGALQSRLDVVKPKIVPVEPLVESCVDTEDVTPHTPTADVAADFEIPYNIPAKLLSKIQEFTNAKLSLEVLQNKDETYCVQNSWHHADGWYCIDALRSNQRFFYSDESGFVALDYIDITKMRARIETNA